MNKKLKTQSFNREWPAQYTAVIKELRGTEAVLDELLDDHDRLAKAISFWRAKSPEKTLEFRNMADELEIEITEIIKQKLC